MPAIEVVEQLPSGINRAIPTLGVSSEGTIGSITAKGTTGATVPTPAAGESLTAVAGTAGVARIVSFAYTAKAEASAKLKLIHNLGTELVFVQAYTTTSKKPALPLTIGQAAKGAIGKWEAVTANETLLTLNTETPGAKEEFIYMVIG